MPSVLNPTSFAVTLSFAKLFDSNNPLVSKRPDNVLIYPYLSKVASTVIVQLDSALPENRFTANLDFLNVDLKTEAV
jgi:hypothetical protein